MDELVDILDSKGKPIGKTALKSQAHKNGWFHPTIHVWLYTLDGRILVQQRGRHKDTHPLLWDVSVAGHVGAGEDIFVSAVREIREEIGLSVSKNDLEKIGFFKSVHKHHESLIDCEFHHTFLCKLQVPLKTLKKQESEVEDLALIPAAQLFKDVVDGAFLEKYVPHGPHYYGIILEALQKRILQ
ncbi:MAG: NUDIX domain-containing protein [Bacteroidota bacterium]